MNVPAFVVFGDATLRQMASHMPLDRDSFLQISGVGESKVQQHGDDFIAAIRDHAPARGANLPSGVMGTPRPRTGQTHLQTLELVREGSNISEIAAARGISQQTVLTHFERLMDEGESFDITHLLPPQHRYVRIAHALRNTEGGRLKPVVDRLGGGYSYEELRLVRLHLRQPGE